MDLKQDQNKIRGMSTRLASSFLASFFFLAACSLVGGNLTGCSLYKSEGRKFLEDKGITFAANSSAAVEWSFAAKQISEPCAELLSSPSLDSDDWKTFSPVLANELPQETLFESTWSNTFEVLVYTETENRHFLCALYFKNTTERDARIETEVEALRHKIYNHLL